MADNKATETRPAIPERERLAVWAAAAGRCTFCNRNVIENEDLGLAVPIGEMAHNVGWSKKSPRGESDVPEGLRQAAGNLILACRNCHKPIDDSGFLGLYTVEQLVKRKREHEERIRTLTSIGADRSAFVVRIASMIRGVPPELSRATVLAATTAAGFYPKRLPGSYWDDIDLDLTSLGDPESRQAFEACLPAIRQLAAKVHDGVQGGDVRHVAVFGFARVPLLIAFGARLDDKLRLSIFQRQRREDDNAWTWPSDPSPAPRFDVFQVRADEDSSEVSLVLNLSGRVPHTDLPGALRATGAMYEINPAKDESRGPSLIDSPAALASFEATLRTFLARMESEHAGIDHINLFAAVPVSAAIVIGRVLMPDVSPSWRVYDRSAQGTFFEALEVEA